MNKENCALKFVDEIILYYDARLKKGRKNIKRIELFRNLFKRRHVLTHSIVISSENIENEDGPTINPGFERSLNL